MVQIVLVDAPDYVMVIVMGLVLMDALAAVMVVQAVDLGAQVLVQIVALGVQVVVLEAVQVAVQSVALGVQVLVLEPAKVRVQVVQAVRVVDLDVLEPVETLVRILVKITVPEMVVPQTAMPLAQALVRADALVALVHVAELALGDVLAVVGPAPEMDVVDLVAQAAKVDVVVYKVSDKKDKGEIFYAKNL